MEPQLRFDRPRRKIYSRWRSGLSDEEIEYKRKGHLYAYLDEESILFQTSKIASPELQKAFYAGVSEEKLLMRGVKGEIWLIHGLFGYCQRCMTRYEFPDRVSCTCWTEADVELRSFLERNRESGLSSAVSTVMAIPTQPLSLYEVLVLDVRDLAPISERPFQWKKISIYSIPDFHKVLQMTGMTSYWFPSGEPFFMSALI